MQIILTKDPTTSKVWKKDGKNEDLSGHCFFLFLLQRLVLFFINKAA
ncbi:hypothetical protein DsansV1_C08g0083451 [Dioscorea sansibarensis]